VMGGHILVAAPKDDTQADDSGAVYLFDASTGDLLQTFYDPNPEGGDLFGSRVAAREHDVYVSAIGKDVEAVYVFDGSTGVLTETLVDPSPSEHWFDYFGDSLAPTADGVLVGHRSYNLYMQVNDSYDTVIERVAAYQFDRSGNVVHAYLDPSVTPVDLLSYHQVATVGDNVVIGDTWAYWQNYMARGYVHIFAGGSDSRKVSVGNAEAVENIDFGNRRLDEDNDGVDDAEEQAGPNNGDGNNDGKPDSEQVECATFRNTQTNEYVTIAAPTGTAINDVQSVPNPSPEDTPQDASFPVGFFDFTVSQLNGNSSAMVTIYLHGAETVNTYWNYGPTPDKDYDHWYPFTWDGETGAIIYADRIELHYVDGLRGDRDLTENGVIVDPGAPGVIDLPWRNPVLPQDVNNDGDVSPLDVLTLIADLNTNGATVLPMFPEDSRPLQPPFVDVAGNDNALSPLDVLNVIAYLNSQASGEGEAFDHVATPNDTHGPMALSTTPLAVSSSSVPLTPGHVQQRRERGLVDTAFWLADEQRRSSEDRRLANALALRSLPKDNSPFDTDDGLTELDTVLADIAQDIDEAWQVA